MSMKHDLHVHCARLLMDDYGVPPRLLARVIAEIESIWDCIALHHSLIVLSVRGHLPNELTKPLESLLDAHRTHPPKYRARR
jgi:hypothetical protein